MIFLTRNVAHRKKMSDEKKAIVEIVGDDLTMRTTNVPSLGICIHFPRSPNASKTTNKYCDCEKGTYIRYLLPCQEKTFPLARLFIFVRCCWAVMSRLIGIHTIQTTTTFLSGILNIARVKHCCKDITFILVSHPPKLYILYRYTDEYSVL